MVNPDNITDAIRDKLRLIPAVMALVDDNSALIASYEDDGKGLAQSVYNMTEPSILVCWMGNDDPENSMTPWLHRFRIYFKLVNTRLGTVFSSIMDTVATGDQQKFTETEFLDGTEQLGIPRFNREQDEDGVEYPNIEMRFRDRSNS